MTPPIDSLTAILRPFISNIPFAPENLSTSVKSPLPIGWSMSSPWTPTLSHFGRKLFIYSRSSSLQTECIYYDTRMQFVKTRHLFASKTKKRSGPTFWTLIDARCWTTTTRMDIYAKVVFKKSEAGTNFRTFFFFLKKSGGGREKLKLMWYLSV